MSLSLFSHPLDEVRVFDKFGDLEFMKKLIDLENLDDPFHLLDASDIIRKNRIWIERVPKVAPHYTVTSNTSSHVIRTLAALGASFDCSTKQDIMHVLAYGVPAERIIFTNSVKTPTQIKYAEQVGVSKLTADSMWELRKIKELYPHAKILIRFRSDSTTTTSSSTSTSCTSTVRYVLDTDESVRLIRGCRDLGLDLHGFSFHVSNPCCEMLTLSRGIDTCRHLIDVARTVGLHDVQLIDVGACIPSTLEMEFDEIWSYFSRLQKSFLYKDLLFDYKHLYFWLNDYYRTTWRYRRTRTTTKTTTYKRTTAALPWR